MSRRKPEKWTPDKIAEIEKLRADGKSWRAISEHYGIRSSGGVYAVYEKYRPGGSWRPTAPWQPIDTAPKDGTFILASKDSEIKIVVYYPALKEWGNPQVWGDNGTWKPTHWMHLPYLPTGEIYE